MTNQRDAAEAVEAAAKAHCDFFGGEGWWDTGLLTDTRPKALDAMRAAIAAYGASLPAASEQEPVATDEHTVLIAAGLDDYAARCALKTGPEGVFCHAYFYSDGQWRFQTGGNDLHMPDGKVLTCVLTKRLYAHPTPSDQEKLVGWQPIETAPKEGWHAPILTCCMGEPVSWFGHEPVAGYAQPPSTAYWNEHADCWTPCQRPHDVWEPTHWRPIPAAPVTRARQNGEVG